MFRGSESHPIRQGEYRWDGRQLDSKPRGGESHGVRLIYSPLKFDGKLSAMPMGTREEQREYQRKWIAQRRIAWVQENGPCAKCGSWLDLEVDHVDPALKAMFPRDIWSRRQEVRDAELAKCQVLCGACHIIKTRVNHDGARGSQISKILTEEMVKEMHRLRGQGKKFTEIGALMGVKPDTARSAVNRQWKHVKGE